MTLFPSKVSVGTKFGGDRTIVGGSSFSRIPPCHRKLLALVEDVNTKKGTIIHNNMTHPYLPWAFVQFSIDNLSLISPGSTFPADTTIFRASSTDISTWITSSSFTI